MNSIIIDCHMHTITKEEFKVYLKTACASKFINIRGLYIDEMLNPYDFEEFIDNQDMYFLDSVDLNNLDSELIKIENDLQKYPRILGVKMYLGYQKYYANDIRIFKVVKFASEHNLAVTFHCGEIYDDDGKSSFSPYSDAKFIEPLAIKYPNTNFIASHINWPNFEDLFSLCNKYNNVYTCFSGTNDGSNQTERNNQNILIAKVINEYLLKYPLVKKKLMYGTDFFLESEDYSDVSSYIKLLDLLNLTNQEKEDICFNNVCNAYKTNFKD